MKFLLKLLVAIASLLGIVLVIALFVDRSFTVERSIEVNTDPNTAFTFFRNLENYEAFDSWLNTDPNTKIWYEGTPGEIGYKLCWESSDKRVGKGEQEMVGFTEGEQIDYKLRFFEPEEMEADVRLTTKSAGENKARVSWIMTGKIPYPWNLSLLFVDMEDEIGSRLQEGLKNAKPLIEQAVL